MQYETEGVCLYKVWFVCTAEFTAGFCAMEIMVEALLGELMARERKLVSCLEVWRFSVNTKGPAFWIWDGACVL